jgi:hypothetical protein
MSKEMALFDFYDENFSGILGREVVKRLMTNAFIVFGEYILEYATQQFLYERFSTYKEALSHKI